MAKLIGANPIPSTVKTRKPIERKYFTKDAIAMCFENPHQWIQLGEEEVDKSYSGSLEKQAERLGFDYYFSPTQKGTKENGYAYKGIPQARYTPAESSGSAYAAPVEPVAAVIAEVSEPAPVKKARTWSSIWHEPLSEQQLDQLAAGISAKAQSEGKSLAVIAGSLAGKETMHPDVQARLREKLFAIEAELLGKEPELLTL